MNTSLINKVVRKLKFELVEKPRFRAFESCINSQTLQISREFTPFRVNELKKEIHPEFQKLFTKHNERLNEAYTNKYKNSPFRVLVHVPPLKLSAGGYSLFMNFIAGLRALGITAEKLEWTDDYKKVSKEFKPNIFLTSDSPGYLSILPWKLLKEDSVKNDLMIGLTASLQRYGSGPVGPRLEWAKENGVGFYYSFRAREYINEEYQDFLQAGFPVINFEFGANHEKFFPIRSHKPDLEYCFFASSNYEKWNRYFEYLPNVFRDFVGLINGPGWSFCNQSIPQNEHLGYYSRCKVGINLHIDDSIHYKSELNERTYILAACGVPQLIDSPKLLLDRFSSKSLFISETPEQYYENFKKILSSPEDALARSISAYDEVMSKHTSISRANDFIEQLKVVSGRS